MEREKKNNAKQNQNEISKRKWYSVIGFLISITLLSIAIFMSINQENNERLARLNTTDVSSTELTRKLNEIKKEELNNAIQSVSTNNNVIESKLLDDNTTTHSVNANTIDNTVDTNSNNTEKNNESENNETNQEQSNENTNTDKNQEQENTTNNAENTEGKSNKEQFIKPVEGDIINIFSMDRLVYSNTLQEWVTHRGLDIKSEKGAEVKAVKDGVIKTIKNDPRYGMSVTIEHKDGFTTVYSCLLNTSDINEGDNVEQGQVIGNIGNSGVFEVSDGMHLHFEIIKDGDYVNPDIYIK